MTAYVDLNILEEDYLHGKHISAEATPYRLFIIVRRAHSHRPPRMENEDLQHKEQANIVIIEDDICTGLLSTAAMISWLSEFIALRSQ